MELEFKFDKRQIKRFGEAMTSQIPFATARALTQTAAQAKDETRKELPKHFLLRNQFTKNSIQHQRAEKRDWPNQKAIIGSISPYMVIQDEGGTKVPRSKAFAIPKGIRTDVSKLVPRSKWPGKILQGDVSIGGGGRSRGAKSGARTKPKAFLLREHDGVGVYIRKGKGRKLKRLFRLTRETIHIRGRHWLYQPVMRIVSANLHKNFVASLEDAMKSQR